MTLKQIAQRVGTSVGTVSVVLNNKGGNVRVSESTRQAILEAARELGYTPNIAARRLRQGRNQMVIALVWTLDSRFPLLLRVLTGIQSYFESENPGLEYEVIVITYRPGNIEQVLGHQHPGQYHGLIIGNSTPADDLFLEQMTAPVPVVRFQRSSQRHPSVNSDGYGAGARVADYFISLGHRRLGLILPEVPSEALTTRRDGFVDRVREHGLTEQLQFGYGPFTEAGGAEAARQLLEPPSRPSAILAMTDTMAFGALYAAKQLGLAVPRDVSVMGFDDTDRSAFYDPPLTTVRVPTDQMAAEAARLLVGQLQRRMSGPTSTVLPCELVLRQSCAAWEEKHA